MVIKTLSAKPKQQIPEDSRSSEKDWTSRSEIYRSFRRTQAVLTVDEDSFIHQDLPHSHPLAPGLQAVALLQQPVHQLFARAALPGGGNALGLLVVLSV